MKGRAVLGGRIWSRSRARSAWAASLVCLQFDIAAIRRPRSALLGCPNAAIHVRTISMFSKAETEAVRDALIWCWLTAAPDVLHRSPTAGGLDCQHPRRFSLSTIHPETW